MIAEVMALLAHTLPGGSEEPPTRMVVTVEAQGQAAEVVRVEQQVAAQGNTSLETITSLGFLWVI